MNREDVATVLAVAAAVDQYAPRPDELVLRVWERMLANVPVEAAERAVTEHYRVSSATITPADIAGWYRVRRRHAPTKHVSPPVVPELIRAGVDRVMTEWAKAKAIASGVDAEEAALVAESNVAARRSVRSVVCPVVSCRAGVGQPCTSNGRSLTKSPAHPGRVDAAFAAAGILADS